MKIQRPASISNNVINIMGVIAALGGLYYCSITGLKAVNSSLICLCAYAVTILSLETLFLKTYERQSVGLAFEQRQKNIFGVFILKLLGLYGSYGFIAALYYLIPEYQGAFYSAYWEILRKTLPVILVLAIPYMFFMTLFAQDPKDAYYWLGRCLIFQYKGVNPRAISQHLLGWIVKGFFLPLMYISFNGYMGFFAKTDIDSITSSFHNFYNFAVKFGYFLDLLVAVSGYVFAIRLFDTHLRSTEPTMTGWFVCLMCYQPFLSTMYLYLGFKAGEGNWLNWLRDYPTLQVLWGTLSLCALYVYVAVSINFGCRFSNLTHRGILTNGMYRFTKHPAYVSKNLFWWLVCVPFIGTQGPWECVRVCILALGLNCIYFIRARTEERHLSHDRTYVEYALWMNENGIFRGLAKRLPFLRYKPPADWQNLPATYDGLK